MQAEWTGLGCRVQGLGFGVQGLEAIRVQRLRIRVWGLELRT